MFTIEASKRILFLIVIFIFISSLMSMKDSNTDTKSTGNNSQNFEKATFAGGCFWCMQPPYDQLQGVKETIVGYAGGHTKNPTYEEVCSGTTGHAEAIEVIYDPKEISYEELLEVFWMNVDPTTPNQQFADVGDQYRSAILYHDEEQKRLAEKSKEDLEKSGRFKKPIVTEITKAAIFYKAEDYHQKYYQKNPFQYKFYRFGSGRDQYLKKTWADQKKE